MTTPETQQPLLLRYWSIIALLASLALGGLIWGVRLEGRVNSNREVLDERVESIEKVQDIRYETLKAEIALMRQQQAITDAKIDRLLVSRP
jgi:hypothetical protein